MMFSIRKPCEPAVPETPGETTEPAEPAVPGGTEVPTEPTVPEVPVSSEEIQDDPDEVIVYDDPDTQAVTEQGT